MRASIVTRLDKLARRVPPTWKDLAGVIFTAGEKMNQAEVDAYLAILRDGDGTPEQLALWNEWQNRNLPRVWAVWDDKYPGWQDAPFWPARPADENGGEWE